MPQITAKMRCVFKALCGEYMTEEYLKNDHLAVSVKRGLAEEIKGAYRVFGWRLEEERTDKRYRNLVHMKFVRDHKIEGKDRLQLLQVRFDVAINFMGKAGGRAGIRALSAGLVLALLGVAMIVCGVLLFIRFSEKLYAALGVALMSAGVAAFILCALAARQLYVRDKRTYSGAAAVIAENIRTTVKEASLITGILPQGSTAEVIARSVVPQSELPAGQRSLQDIPAPNGGDGKIVGTDGGRREGGDGN